MARLIDAEKVEEEINECVWDAYGSNEDEMGFAYSIARGIIENAPTVDAIPIEWIKEQINNYQTMIALLVYPLDPILVSGWDKAWIVLIERWQNGKAHQ